MRIIGFILTVLGMSAIASMNFNDMQNFSAGGLVGDVIASAVVPLFGGVGANLMLLCFVATGITLFTGWSRSPSSSRSARPVPVRSALFTTFRPPSAAG